MDNWGFIINKIFYYKVHFLVIIFYLLDNFYIKNFNP